jgi:2,3-bisphosphoglycerate-independent phosphoglycerate mutase
MFYLKGIPMPANYLKPLLNNNHSKIILLILDGLGGLPLSPGGKTELETANTPNMDALAKLGALGQTIPIAYGVTPGSGPAHLSLFGFDPLTYSIGRGVLSASGVGITVNPGDVAARGNFCTIDEDGNITDRRAGRIGNEIGISLVEKLKSIDIPGVEIELAHVKEYRFTIVMRGDNLGENLADTDPQKTGVPPLTVTPTNDNSINSAKLFNIWVEKATELLAGEPKANGLTLRGFATNPQLPSYQDIYGLKAACVAVYPMYKGVAGLVDMDIIQFEGEYPEDQFKAVEQHWDDYDFFFVHIKKTDSMGEDGNFDGKVKIIESVDKALPILQSLSPDVLMITGDHSTPAKMKSHSWHPVPFLMHSPKFVFTDQQVNFGESNCRHGGLGTFHATETMPLALGHAGRLGKYGA